MQLFRIRHHYAWIFLIGHALFTALDGNADAAGQQHELAVPTADALVDAVVTAYRRYWGAVLTEGDEARQANELVANLLIAVSRHAGDAANPSAETVQEVILDLLRERGLKLSYSPAPPMRDLLIWRRQHSGRYTIGLTDRTLRTNVRFAGDFILRGWRHHATQGQASTTGWIENRMLYCVESAYAKGTEHFEVSFLKHEGRHLADLEKFPGLPAVELEYRAKLTELAFADHTMKSLLHEFDTKGAANPAAPHAAANLRVMDGLRAELSSTAKPDSAAWWKTVEAAHIRKAARRLLSASDEALAANPR